MERFLLVAEKDSLMRKIQEVYDKHRNEVVKKIGGEIDFTALSGHIVKWYEPEDYPEWNDHNWKNVPLPLVPDPFLIKPEDGKYQKEKLKEFQAAIKSGKYSGYICACDPDPEGGLIYWRAAKYLKIDDKPTLRFFQNSLTEKEILEALLNMENFIENNRDRKLLEQALSRSQFDWLVGMNCTRAMTLKAGVLSHIGRVKAPTIKIVYDNSCEIDAFQKKITYQPLVSFGDFSGGMIDSDGKDVDFEKQEDAQKIVDELSDSLQAKVISVTKKTETKSPEQLFNLAALQAIAGKYDDKLSKPSAVLEVCQSLYEKGITSYPRTACRQLSSARAEEFPDLLNILSCIPELKPYVGKVTEADIGAVKKNKAVVNDAKVAEESHDALLCCGRADFDSLTKEEQVIYTLIAKRFLSQFLPKLKEAKTVLISEIKGKKFKSNGSSVVEPGWTVLYERQAKSQLISDTIKEGDDLFVDEYSVKKKETKPAERLTAASLITVMENAGKLIKDEELKGSLRAGIGTAATRAAIIDAIIAEKYVRTEGKNQKLYITDAGKDYIKRLGWCSIVNPENAAYWETVFFDVRDGKKTFGDAFEECLEYIRGFIKEVNESDIKAATNELDGTSCPYCGGKIKSIKYSYVCENTGDGGSCCFQVEKADGKVKEEDIKDLIENGKTRKIAKVCYSKSKDKYYDAALKLNPAGSEKTYSLVFGDESEQPKEDMSGIACPFCGRPVLARKYSFACEGYKDEECSFAINRCDGKFTLDHLKELIDNKKTNLIKKICYSKKKKKSYDAYVVLNPEGSERVTSFEFPPRRRSFF